MTLIEVNEEISKYMYAPPYISNQIGVPPDGNPILYMGLFLCAKRQFFRLEESDVRLVQQTYDLSKKAPGLITRGIHKFNDHEAHDDVIGMTHASYFTNSLIADEIYSYGHKNWWCYNPAGLTGFAKLKCFHSRLPGVVQHYKMAACEGLSVFDRVWWALRFFIPGGGESAVQLSWLMIDLYKNNRHKYWICDLAVKIWENRFSENELYPNGMGSVFEKYFGKDHFLTKIMS